MAGGGIYDQVGGGFARYSVDARWIVPHFEKMLYDNALLARAYLHGFQVTGEPFFERVAPRDARLGAARAAPGRRAASRARSTPTPRASRASSTSGRSTSCASVLGDDADAAIEHFGVTEARQLRGRQHPRARHAPTPSGSPRSRPRLLAAREQRVLARARRQAPDRLERADDRGARRRRRGARRRRATATPRVAARRVRAARPARRRRPAAAHLQPRPGAAQRLPRGPRVPARGAARRSTRRRSSRAGSPRRARSPTR